MPPDPRAGDRPDPVAVEQQPIPEPAAFPEKRRLYLDMLTLVTRLAQDRQSLRDELQRHVRV